MKFFKVIILSVALTVVWSSGDNLEDYDQDSQDSLDSQDSQDDHDHDQDQDQDHPMLPSHEFIVKKTFLVNSSKINLS
jgi:ABC-type nickel/cobalt efflux system permease component RcnA